MLFRSANVRLPFCIPHEFDLFFDSVPQHRYASRGADSDTHNRLIETLITDRLAGIGSLRSIRNNDVFIFVPKFRCSFAITRYAHGEYFLGRDPRITHKLVYPAMLAGTRIIETTRWCAISPLLRSIRNDESP